MKVVKKLNNNVAVCLDNDGEQLVAFGKGIGFPSTPYELTDLSKITMTFYNLDMKNFQLLKDIPSEIFDLSAEIVAQAKQTIHKSLNPNLVFTLSDHINFALKRLQDYQGLQLPFSYEIEQFYPLETKIGYQAVELIKKRLHVDFPLSEVSAIAMHLVNSQTASVSVYATEKTDEDLIETITDIFEQEFDIVIDRKSFDYNRFVMHLRYYLKRIHDAEQITSTDITSLFLTMQNEEPEVYLCAKRMADYIDEQLQTQSTQDEIFYLSMYVKRISSRLKSANALDNQEDNPHDA